jgi:putative membrane protein
MRISDRVTRSVNEQCQTGNVAKSVVAGALGGLVAAFAMNQFQALWAKVAKDLAQERGKQQDEKEDPGGGGDDATVKTARAISHSVFDHELTDAEKKWAGPAVHYGLGTLLGAVYGVLAETVPEAAAGYGAAYGSAVWLGADEIAVPVFGLSGPPTQTPVIGHVQALAAHVVYGVTTDLTRRALLAATTST